MQVGLGPANAQCTFMSCRHAVIVHLFSYRSLLCYIRCKTLRRSGSYSLRDTETSLFTFAFPLFFQSVTLVLVTSPCFRLNNIIFASIDSESPAYAFVSLQTLNFKTSPVSGKYQQSGYVVNVNSWCVLAVERFVYVQRVAGQLIQFTVSQVQHCRNVLS